MRFTEKDLLKVAYQAVCELGLTTFAVRNFDFEEFVRRASGTHAFASSFEGPKHGAIQALAIGSATEYRKTTVLDVAGQNNYLLWDGSDPKGKMAFLTRPVLLGAMFDILATRHVLDCSGYDSARSTRYRPQPSMPGFVRRLALPRSPIPVSANAA